MRKILLSNRSDIIESWCIKSTMHDTVETYSYFVDYTVCLAYEFEFDHRVFHFLRDNRIVDVYDMEQGHVSMNLEVNDVIYENDTIKTYLTTYELNVENMLDDKYFKIYMRDKNIDDILGGQH